MQAQCLRGTAWPSGEGNKRAGLHLASATDVFRELSSPVPPFHLSKAEMPRAGTDQKSVTTNSVRTHINTSESTSQLLPFQALNLKNNEHSDPLFISPCHFPLHSSLLCRNLHVKWSGLFTPWYGSVVYFISIILTAGLKSNSCDV